ncbi:hypothetical protein [Rhodopila globiformis]|uniref:Uncharacterized protein n=1 Tax=Rhodopila globiformis TaxID=1071 RepID=A0A2S6NNY1_RHOGL|nr:hypothetical protein [Rhodopila globiformis]PPQ39507.1 hypothetical protein CCS01_01365 [Rhodopila globiformis]
MLHIQTFDARAGGNVLYKALAHPLAAEAIERLYARLDGPVALYDPDGIADALAALYPRPFDCLFVHDVALVGQHRAGLAARPLTALPASGARTVLVAAFDAARIVARIAPLLPAGAAVLTLDEARLPGHLLSVPGRYLDKLNFATNFAFFRDADGLSTRLVSANYWAGYGARHMRLWLRLFDAGGKALATWEQDLPAGPGGFAIDSRDARRRFGLDAFTGQLFIHAVGATGHDVVKYALDTYASDNGASLSCTHDANAWPSDRFAGLPAPRADERVVLWLQNSHAAPIPVGTIALDRMGAGQPVALDRPVGPFATVALDVADLLPDVRWPAQIELRAGRHVVRPRYEVTRAGRVRIAHVNVERDNLRADPGIPALPEALGRGYLLPFPILPRVRFRTVFQPTPMATTQTTLPLRLEVFDTDGTRRGERFLGCLPRDHSLAMDLDGFDVEQGHAELVYDFRDGGEADGWMHALFRYEDRVSGHGAESSFGAHIFNTAMTYRDEPQSYSGPPPGLSTRLFLRLGDAWRRSFAVLIYPASAPWQRQSATALQLHDGSGRMLAEHPVRIACSGSVMIWPHQLFASADLAAAGAEGYVLVRDTTCRLFGYHGLMDEAGGFSLDHMFGF